MSLEITVIDSRTEAGDWWFLPRYAGPMTSAVTVGEIYMTSAVEMVNGVLSKAGSTPIDLLNIIDHGYAGGLQLGDDWVTPNTIQNFSGTLGRLNGHFTPGGVGVFLMNCEVGQARQLLVDLARIFGAAVTAGTGLSNAIYGFNTGDYVTAFPNGHVENDVRRPRLRVRRRDPWSNGKMCCFPAGTLVSAPDGARPIEQLASGDQVHAWDVASASPKVRRVLELQVHKGQYDLRRVGLGSGSSVAVTDTHRFGADDGGWIPSERVDPGQPLRAMEGTEVVSSVRPQLEVAELVYNLRVEGLQSYFVGPSRLLVRDH